MVARDRVTMISLTMPWDDVVRTAIASPFSRLPVYRGTPDQIVGVLRVKDLVERYLSDGPMPVERLMRPLVTVPETLPADQVVTHLRDKRAHAAVVVDEADRAVGLITIQDLLEELLGQAPAAEPVPLRPAGH
jgi:CBS domain containing-hemolysin-like protein